MTADTLWSASAVISLLKQTFVIGLSHCDTSPSVLKSSLSPPVICPFCCSHPLSSSRGAVAFGGRHGGRRWARRVHRGPPSLPVPLFPLPSTSGLPAQERHRGRPPGHGSWLQPGDCSGGKANPRQQGQAEEKVCKFDPSFPFFIKIMNGFGSRDTFLFWNILVELYVQCYHTIAQYHPRLWLRLKCDPSCRHSQWISNEDNMKLFVFVLVLHMYVCFYWQSLLPPVFFHFLLTTWFGLIWPTCCYLVSDTVTSPYKSHLHPEDTECVLRLQSVSKFSVLSLVQPS